MHFAESLVRFSQEDLPDALGSQPGATRWYEIVPVKAAILRVSLFFLAVSRSVDFQDGDVLVFESAAGASQFRRFVAAKSSWNEACHLCIPGHCSSSFMCYPMLLRSVAFALNKSCQAEELPLLSVNAAVQSPANPEKDQPMLELDALQMQALSSRNHEVASANKDFAHSCNAVNIEAWDPQPTAAV